MLLVHADEKNSPESDKILAELEEIDEESDELKVLLVKIADAKLATRYSITKLPSLVYFKKKYPSVFR